MSLKKLVLLVSLSLSATAASCPPKPEVHEALWTVRDITNAQVLTDVTGKLDTGTCYMEAARLHCKTTNTAGYLTVSSPGYVTKSEAVYNLDSPEHGSFLLSPVFVPLPRITQGPGPTFALDNGDPFVVIGTSDFQLLRYSLEGLNIEDYLHDRECLIDEGGNCYGFNWLRVFMTMDGNLGRLHPQDYDFNQYISTAVTLARKAARHRQYIEFTVFADATAVFGNCEQEINFWNAVTTSPLAQETNVVFELGNELDQDRNRLACQDNIQPPQAFSSHGSNGSDTVPPRPAWNYEVYHTNDAFQWPRKAGHNAMELGDDSGCAAFADENTRPDSDPVLSHHTQAAKCAALLSAGYTFHSISGRDGLIFSGRDREFAIEVVKAIRSIPLFCQGQPYKHRTDLEQPDAGATGERAYQRGDDELCVCHYQP